MAEWKKRSNSIRGYLFVSGALCTLLFLALFLCFGGFILVQYHRNYKEEHDALTAEYARSFEQDMDSMESYIRNLYSDNAHYQQLKRQKISQMQWMSAAWYLSNTLAGKAANIDYFGGVFYYDADWDSMRSQYSSFPYAGNQYGLNQEIKTRLRESSHGLFPYEETFLYEGEAYLMYAVGGAGHLLGYTINLSRYFPNREDMQLLIWDKDGGALLANLGECILEEEELKLPDGNGRGLGNLTQLVSCRQIAKGRLTLAVIREEYGLIFWSKAEFQFLFILVPVLAFLGFWKIYRFIRKILYQPIEHVMYRLAELREESAESGAGTGTGPQPSRNDHAELEEVRVINEKLDQMIAELRQLEQAGYEKEKEANAALLQYYQLQIRPHFFLNCLNVMSSLLGRNDLETVKTLIYSVSRHFRYVFQDSNNLVTLKEELEEVSAYCSINIIKNNLPVLLQTEVEDGLDTVRIPVLSIQTFVENSLKYAVREDQVLSIAIRAEQAEVNGERYVCIHISDNGSGYQMEQLESLNRPVTGFQYHSMQVGVDNIKYRIYLLYGERAKVCFFNNPSGGAVTEILLPQGGNESADY